MVVRSKVSSDPVCISGMPATAIRQHCEGSGELWCKPQLRFRLKSCRAIAICDSGFDLFRGDSHPPRARNKFRAKDLHSSEDRIDSFETAMFFFFFFDARTKWDRCQMIRFRFSRFQFARENFGKSSDRSFGSRVERDVGLFFIFFAEYFFPQFVFHRSSNIAK